MIKCGKGCMPECQYFTTCGCISPFNCPYKIETGYINSATSIPTYMEQYNGMSDDNIKCLKAENADLHERLKEAEHRAEVAELALKKACCSITRSMTREWERCNDIIPLVVESWQRFYLNSAERQLREEAKNE